MSVSFGGGRHPAELNAPDQPLRRRDLSRDVPAPRLILRAYAVGAAIVVGAAGGVDPIAGVAALAVAAFGALAIYRTDIAALTLVALVPILSGVHRGLPVPGFRPTELLIGVTSALILVAADRRRQVPWRTFDWLALAYVIATAALGSFDLIERGAGFTWDSVGKMAGPLQFFLLYRAVAVALPTWEDRRRALQLVLLASVPVALLTLMQQFGLLGVRDLMVDLTGTDIYTAQLGAGETPRATGPFPHWHQLGGYLLLVILLGIGLQLLARNRVLPKWAIISILAVDAAALVQTVTIAAIFGAIGGTILLGYWMHRLRPVINGVLIAAVLAVVFASPVIVQRFEQQWVKAPGDATSPLVPNTLDYRWQVWSEEYFPALKGHWLTGYGPDPPPGLRFGFSESLYIELILRGGLLLLAVYAAMTVALWGFARRAMLSESLEPEERVVASVLAATLILLLLIHVIEPYFLDSGPPHVLWSLAGLVAASAAGARGSLRRRSRREGLIASSRLGYGET